MDPVPESAENRVRERETASRNDFLPTQIIKKMPEKILGFEEVVLGVVNVIRYRPAREEAEVIMHLQHQHQPPPPPQLQQLQTVKLYFLKILSVPLHYHYSHQQLRFLDLRL